jgi:hypothetical protein
MGRRRRRHDRGLATAVERTHGDVRDGESEPDPNSLTAGSVYGGLHFIFDDQGKVTQIFLGAAAE